MWCPARYSGSASSLSVVRTMPPIFAGAPGMPEGFIPKRIFTRYFTSWPDRASTVRRRAPSLVQAGDLVLVRPTDFHYIVGSPGSGVECINIALPSEVWEGMLDVAEVAAAGDWLKSQLPRLMRLPVDAANRAESVFRGAVERYTLVQDRLDLLRLVLDVLELLTDPSEVGQGSLRPSWLVRACTAMSREENLRGGVPRLVELAGVSHGHLCHAMHDYSGTTPTALVSELRLRHAETLICTTSLSLTEIASRCGFASLSYFSKVFRSAHHASPREFRRLARKNAPI